MIPFCTITIVPHRFNIVYFILIVLFIVLQGMAEQIVMGGGAINETPRVTKTTSHSGSTSTSTSSTSTQSHTHYDPRQHQAHLLHSIMGLDRYPNYLSRWSSNMEDIDKLQEALTHQLEKVKRQKENLMQRRNCIRHVMERAMAKKKEDHEEDHEDHDYNDYNNVDWTVLRFPHSWEQIRRDILHEDAARAIFQSKMFQNVETRPKVHHVLEGRDSVELDLGRLEEWLNEEFFDVYSMPLFSRSFCIRLKRAIQAILDQAHLEGEMDIGKRAMDLDMMGVGWINDLVFHLIMKPLSKELFETTEALDRLDWRHGYIAGYSNVASEKVGATRNFLVPHTDDSEVTLNVGMGDDEFEGGELRFWNLRGTRQEGELVGEFRPEMGVALIHSGRHLHEVKHVTKGNRFAYIIWARSWLGVRKQSCPCCWINRRKSDERCICKE